MTTRKTISRISGALCMALLFSCSNATKNNIVEMIEDPFFRLNEHDVQWIDKCDWVYNTQLEVPAIIMEKQRIVLQFEGLDTHADVNLNEQLILEADNMFREWEVDVKLNRWPLPQPSFLWESISQFLPPGRWRSNGGSWS